MKYSKFLDHPKNADICSYGKRIMKYYKILDHVIKKALRYQFYALRNKSVGPKSS